MSTAPVVLQSKSLMDSMTTILALEAPCTLLICFSKASFIRAFIEETKGAGKHPILTPALESIDRSSTVRVHFCESVPSLHTRLAVLNGSCKSLAVMYPLALHADTSARSAQGLAKTISSAVDAAIRVGAQLRLMEPSTPVPPTAFDEHHQVQHEAPTSQNPWDQHLPILNATASRFGSERAWVGRTVTARQVASRWCTWE
jgi:hypothetical protein